MAEILCRTLTETLDDNSGIANHDLPTAISTISMIGRLAPAVFVRHASTVTQTVLEQLMYDSSNDEQENNVHGEGAAKPQGKSSMTGKLLPMAISRPVAVKMGCLKVCR